MITKPLTRNCPFPDTFFSNMDRFSRFLPSASYPVHFSVLAFQSFSLLGESILGLWTFGDGRSHRRSSVAPYYIDD